MPEFLNQPRRKQLLRRRLIGGLLALPLAVISLGAAAADPPLQPTPPDDYGPFYPPDWSGEIDADLSRFAGARAEGTRLRLNGVVRDSRGKPLADTIVEIWQTDARGRYRHPGVPAHLGDPGFQGYGRTTTGADGSYGLTTVVPGRYGTRPPHIHFRVAPSGRQEFVTQIYFRGDNGEGGLGGIVPPGRDALSVDTKAEAGGRATRFDLVLPAD